MSIDRGLSLDNFTDRLIQFLDDDTITEISVNRPDEAWTYNGKWICHEIDFSYDELDRMSRAASVFAKRAGKSGPILSGNLSNGARLQMTLPPACKDGTIILSIRKPSKVMMDLAEFEERGFFNYIGSVEYFVDQVKRGRTIVVAGSTNSGKTTFINALLQVAPITERIITIEDIPELRIPHRNSVSLFYQALGVSATEQLRNALRLNPDRVILSECRGGEALDFINVAASGHQGSMTSCHADSCELALKRMEMMAMEKSHCPSNVMETIRSVVDTVVHIRKDGDSRFITEILEL